VLGTTPGFSERGLCTVGVDQLSAVETALTDAVPEAVTLGERPTRRVPWLVTTI
jgi:hypothetical protein